jgi:hypothetical protein
VRREAPEVATRALAVVTWRERRRAPEVLAVAAAARRRLLRRGCGASLASLLVRPVRKPLGYDLVMAALAALVQDPDGRSVAFLTALLARAVRLRDGSGRRDPAPPGVQRKQHHQRRGRDGGDGNR